MDRQRTYRFILSGGGTGGHIYPAVAVAEALHKKLGSGVEILFVGAEGKMEMEKIPALGYSIEGLPVIGIQRRLSLSHCKLPFKVARSLHRASRIIRQFRPDAVAGFGGYASGPVLWSAQRKGIPTLIQEQNSYAGLTNRILGRGARVICVAYEGMERFFGPEKIKFTGNPLRNVFNGTSHSDDTQTGPYFGFKHKRPTVLVLGGSLGTRTLNEMMKKWIDRIIEQQEVNIIWQTGKYYYDEMQEFMQQRDASNIWYGPFIERMDLAYAAADVIITRSGANTVSELCIIGKPVIFVPSPNVSEDHQTSNARALESKGAAILIRDDKAIDEAIPEALELLTDKGELERLSSAISGLAITNSADVIADQLINLANQKY